MNKYGVPAKQWRRWSPRAQAVFNNVFRTMKDQIVFVHPETHPLHPEEWDTIRWNAAWLAANASDGYKTRVRA